MKDDNGNSDVSMDEKLEMGAIKTLDKRRAGETAIQELKRSKKKRKLVKRYGNTRYMVQYRAYMENVRKVVDLTCFEEAKCEQKWRDAMEEEM